VSDQDNKRPDPMPQSWNFVFIVAYAVGTAVMGYDALVGKKWVPYSVVFLLLSAYALWTRVQELE